MRCLALAQEWQDQGGKAVFLSHCESEPLRQRIVSEGFDLIPIEHPYPDPSDLEQTFEVLKRYALCAMPSAAKQKPPDPRSLLPAAKPWLCLDGYHFTPDYQKTIRDAGIRLLVIDDMNHFPDYHADILLNQNIHAPDLHYHYDPDTTLLMGTRYVLLRKEFLKYQNFKRQIPEKAKNILITMGGSDPENVTLKVIQAIKLLNDLSLEVKVVLGSSNPHVEAIRNAMRHAPCAMHCIQNAKDMPDLMAWADMAISAGGSTCWELAFMGVPMLTVILADNQQGIAEGLERRSVGCNMGFFKALSADLVLEMVSDLVKNENRRSKMSENAIHLVDGAGRKRVLTQLKEKE